MTNAMGQQEWDAETEKVRCGGDRKPVSSGRLVEV